MKKMRWVEILALASSLTLIPSMAFAWPWSTDMSNQISIKPQHGPIGVSPFPARSVPVPSTKTSMRVADRDEAEKLANPVPASAASIHNGQKLFEIFCSACHNFSGKGDGLVGMKLTLQPFDLTSDGVQKDISEGFIFGYITFGGAVMPSYADDLSPNERWDVINFVRHGLLQYSKDYLAKQAKSAHGGAK